VKKIIALTIAFCLAISMVSIGAWAFLTSAELTNNEIYAGTIELTADVSGTGPAGKYTLTPAGGGFAGSAAFDYLFPGDAGSITWVLVNCGTMPGTLTLASLLTLTDVSQNEAELAVPGNDTTGAGDLGYCLGVKLQAGIGADQSSAEGAFTYLLGSASNYAALENLDTTLNNYTVAMAPEDTVVIKLTWQLPLDIKKAGTDGLFGTADDIDVNENIVQGDNAEIDITFTLSQ